MSPLKKVFGLFLASLMDIGSGIIITWLVWTLLVLEIHWYTYIFGIFFSMAPDLDILAPLVRELLGGRAGDSSHKALPTHYPLVMIGAVGAVLWVFLCGNHALLASTCLFIHFFHDSWQSGERGPGVRWLAPFKESYYQIFSRHRAGERLQLFLVVSPRRVEETFKETLEEWLTAIFFRFTFENVIGIVTFLLSIILARYSLR